MTMDTPQAPTASPLPSDTPQPAPTETSAVVETQLTSQVALVRTSDRAQGVRQAIELLGVNPVEGKKVFLKPNLNSADPAPGSTHPDVLRSLVLKLQEMGASALTVGDRSGMGDTAFVMRQLGVSQMGEELGFDTVVLDDLQRKDWVDFQPPGSHWQRGFLFARPCLEAEALVQTCCLKTHRFGGVFTMSLKNSVGMVAKRDPASGYEFMQELHSSPHQTSMIAEINFAYTPALVVLDGVEVFISGGPDQGQKAAPGVVLAGTDRLAIDAVGVAILRMFGANLPGPVFEQNQIARAVELGLGVDSPDKIEFLTGDPESAAFVEKIRDSLFG